MDKMSAIDWLTLAVIVTAATYFGGHLAYLLLK